MGSNLGLALPYGLTWDSWVSNIAWPCILSLGFIAFLVLHQGNGFQSKAGLACFPWVSTGALVLHDVYGFQRFRGLASLHWISNFKWSCIPIMWLKKEWSCIVFLGFKDRLVLHQAIGFQHRFGLAPIDRVSGDLWSCMVSLVFTIYMVLDKRRGFWIAWSCIKPVGFNSWVASKNKAQ